MPEYFDETPFVGRVTYLGHVADREAALASAPQPDATVGFEGIAGEAHGGLTRPACSRVAMLHPRDVPIRNTRQITLLSAEELAQTAANMGLSELDPAWVGASLVVEGIPDLSHLPPSSRLQGPDGVTLTVDMINHPCTLSGKSVEGFAPGFGPAYKPAAMGLRGVTAWVEREGRLALGDSLRLFVPTQRPWAPEGA